MRSTLPGKRATRRREDIPQECPRHLPIQQTHLRRRRPLEEVVRKRQQSPSSSAHDVHVRRSRPAERYRRVERGRHPQQGCLYHAAEVASRRRSQQMCSGEGYSGADRNAHLALFL